MSFSFSSKKKAKDDSDSEADEKDEKEDRDKDGDDKDGGEKEDDGSVTIDPLAGNRALLFQETLADVHFLVGKTAQERIPAHRLILAANNAVFRAMLYPLTFSADSKTAKYSAAISEADANRDIVIDDTTPAAFRKLIQSVYTDDIEVTANDVTELIQLAKRYQVESLKAICVEYMEQDVSTEKACQLFVEGRKLLNEPGFGLSFIEENIEDVTKTDGFAELPRDCLEAILRSGKLVIDEGDLWTAVDKWAAAEVRRNGKKVDGPAKREALGSALQLIRFPLIDMGALCTLVQPSNVLSQEELLSLFTYSAAPEEKKPKTAFISREREGGGGKVQMEEFEWDTKQSHMARVRFEGGKVVSIAPTCNADILAIGDVNKGKGWSSGLHYWRINIQQGGCYRRVGVVDGEFPKDRYNQGASTQYPPVLGSTPNSWGVAIGSAGGYQEMQLFNGALNSFPTGEVGLLLDAKRGKLHVFSSTGQFIATAFSNIKGKKLRPAVQICHPPSQCHVMPKKGATVPAVPKDK